MTNVKKIIEYGLYLLVFLLPIQTRWIIKAGELNGGYSEYNTISLYGVDILLLALLLIFTINKIKNKKSKIKNTIKNLKLLNSFYIWLFIFFLSLTVLASIFFAPNKILAVFSCFRFLLGIGLFWLIVSANYSKAKLLWSLLAGASIQACLGIWQFITQTTFSSKWLGIAAHKAGELGTSVVETAGKDGIGERWLRAYGGLDHPNMLGGFLAVALLLLVILYINKKPEERVNPNKIFNFQTVFLFFCFFVFLPALFFSFSRAAWLGLVAGLFVMIFFTVRQKNIAGLKRMAEIMLPAISVVFALSILYNNLVFTRIASAGRLEVKSNIERVESYKFAREIIKKNWLFGTGIGNYTLALKNEISLKRQGYYYQPVHNTFLLVWAETGIFGLLGYLGLLGILGWRIIKSKNYYHSAVLTALIIIMLVDHWLWSLHFGLLFFWLTMGLIAKTDEVL
jgi:hypothetical protein